MGRLTQKSVAEQLGISPTVVSLVLRDPTTNRASDETKSRIFSLLGDGDRPSIPAQAIGARAGELILMITENPEPDYYFTYALLCGVQARVADYSLTLQMATPAEDLRATLVSPRLSGILLGAYSGVLTQHRHYLDYANVVTLNATERGPIVGQAVMPDYFMGTELAIDHLVESGHRRVGYIGYEPEQGSGERGRYAERLRHVREACLYKPLISLDSDICLIPKERDNAHLRELLGEVLTEWKSNGDMPTAVVIYNDLMAVQFYHVAREMGVNIPVDLSVVSVDNEPLGKTLVPALTSVSPEFFEVGRTAVDLLAAGLLNADPVKSLKVLCPTRLEIRESVTTPREQS